MPDIIDQRGGPSANALVNGPLSGLGETQWLSLNGQGLNNFTASIEESVAFVGTLVVEARRAYKDGSYSATKILFTSNSAADFPKNGRLAGFWDVRLRCSVYSAGTFTLAVTQ